MMIYNEAETLRTALSDVEGVKSVTRGWPRSFASKNLPCIAIQKASEVPADYADDGELLTEIEYYIRIFADKFEQADAIAPRVDKTMEKLGYRKTMTYDADDRTVRIIHMRYHKYL